MSNKHNEDSGLSTLLAVPLLVGLIVFGLWYKFGHQIISFSFDVSATPFELFAQLPDFLVPSQKRIEMAQLSVQLESLRSEDYGWSAFKNMLDLWGYGLRAALLPLLIFLVLYHLKLPANYYYRRELSLRQLAEQNSEMFPCVLPALGKNLHKQNPFVGPWRIADDHIDFAAGNALLLYKGKPIDAISPKEKALDLRKKRKLFPHFSYVTLDTKKTDNVFRNQLGKPWRGIDALDDMTKALAGALMAGVAGGQYREQCLTLLDQLSRTFVEASPGDGTPATVSAKGVKDLIAQVQSHEDVQDITTGYGFESTVIIALLVQARLRVGKIPPSSFLWLRPANRTLWYSLHPIGGRKPWNEGAAAWVHYHAEKDLGHPIATPVIEGATDGLEAELHHEQWIRSQPLWEKEQGELNQEMQDVMQAREETARANQSVLKKRRKR